MSDTATIHTLTIPGRQPIEWDTSDNDSVIKAQAEFDKAKSKGLLAYATTDSGGGGKGGTVIRDFDPMVDIRMQTQTAGG
jgi:hypothetical protein